MKIIQNWLGEKKNYILLFILMGLCLTPLIYLFISMKVSESYYKSMCKYYHPGEIIYNFDDNNASVYIQQVESYLNFPQYQERWGAHLIYSLSGTKNTNGVNTTLLPEITTCRISQPLDNIIVDINYSDNLYWSYEFLIILNASYFTYENNETFLRISYNHQSPPAFHFSIPYSVYFVVISMDYEIYCGPLSAQHWEEYYWIILHENGDILMTINKVDCKCVIA